MRRFPFWAYCACAAIWVFMSVGQQGVVGRTMYVLTAISISEAAAFVFAGKAATVLRLVGKF